MKQRVECHVFAGLGGFFTSGGTKAIEKLIDDLPHEAEAHHHYHREWSATAAAIIARQRKYQDSPIVILIGHSYGAWKCQQIALRLKTFVITVHYVAGIDPTALPLGADPMRIPTNVLEVDEFWSTRGLFNAPLSVRKRHPDGSRGGKYVYPTGIRPRVFELPGTGHIPAARHPTTVNTIVARVRKLLP